MENDYTDNFHKAAVEESEEVLSLCDLPLEEETITRSQSKGQSHDQFFEFISDQSFDTCPAEDIIFCGKLIPRTPQAVRILSYDEDEKQARRLHRRSGSLSELECSATRSNTSTDDYKLFRTSHSLDDQKLHRFGDSGNERSDASFKSVGKYDDKKTVAKPKWYFPMIGVARIPLGMDMRDIKSRQVRRSSLMDPKETFPANRISGSHKASSSSWRLIKALSCNDHASVAVRSSFCVVPKA